MLLWVNDTLDDTLFISKLFIMHTRFCYLSVHVYIYLKNIVFEFTSIIAVILNS